MEAGLSPEDKLSSLLEGIARVSHVLGLEARAVANEGKDVEETKTETDPKTGKTKKHTFLQRVPLTTQEAIDRVLDLLTSRLVELPMAINTVQDELGRCFEVDRVRTSSDGQQSERIAIELELGGAGDLVSDGAPKTQQLRSYSAEEIARNRSNIDALRKTLQRSTDRDN